MALRNYSSTTPKVLLSVACDDSIGFITLSNVDDVFPAPPFTLILEDGTANEEIVEVTSKNSTSNFFSVTRGVDGSTAKAHAQGVEVIHGVSARDFREAVKSDTVTQIVTLTQAAYDALTPDANTLYVITD
jgi:hypothetical protein